MKKELGHSAPRAITAHHFFTSLNFIVLIISVVSLSFHVYILRREIEIVKADIRPLVAENDKIASRLYEDYFDRPREARQIEPGPDEFEGTLEPEEPTEGEIAPEVSREQHGATTGGTRLNCSMVRIFIRCYYQVVKYSLNAPYTRENHDESCTFQAESFFKVSFKLWVESDSTPGITCCLK